MDLTAYVESTLPTNNASIIGNIEQGTFIERDKKKKNKKKNKKN